MKKILIFLALVIAAAILVQAVPFTVADGAGVSNYEKEAKQQHTIDLYKGTDTGLDPDVILNRETGIVMLLRLVGKEDEAELMPEADVKTKLAEFKDSDTVSSWAKKQVAYAVDMGIVKGYPNNILAPNDPLNGKMYCTLILRELGYAVDGPAYHDAPWTLTGIGGLTSAEADRLGEKDLLRDDLVGMSIGALSAVGIDGQRLVDRLIKEGQIDEDAALSLGFVFPTPTPTPTPSPSPTPTPTPTPTASTHNDHNDDDDDDDDDDDNIVGTGVTSSLEYEQGSLGAREVYRLTVGEAAASGRETWQTLT